MGGLGKAGSGAGGGGGGSFPDLSNTCRLSKLGKLMGCSFVIPFQMMETPTAEMEERALDSAEDMAEHSTFFLCIHRLHSG